MTNYVLGGTLTSYSQTHSEVLCFIAPQNNISDISEQYLRWSDDTNLSINHAAILEVHLHEQPVSWNAKIWQFIIRIPKVLSTLL